MPHRIFVVLEIDLEAHTTRIDGEPVELTTREFALLSSLIAASGRVVRRATLLKEAWGLEHWSSRSRFS